MNEYLEATCRLFGPTSCENASVTDLVVMALTIATSIILAIWFMGKLGVSLQS